MFVLANELGLSNEGFVGLGWLRELPDFRDYTVNTPEIKALLSKCVIPK
jgi:hypothetical protein